MQSNVPVGTCLSGGLDSSSIVAIQNKIFEDKIQTFSVIWEDKECDESKYINLIAKNILYFPITGERIAIGYVKAFIVNRSCLIAGTEP